MAPRLDRTVSHHKQTRKPLKEAYEAYRYDHHLAVDTIAVLTRDELVVLLMSMWSAAPNAVAKALAIEQPDVELAFQGQEERTQALLPLTWKDRQAMSAFLCPPPA